ncbi:MAG: hypothetical protein IJF02_03565 [Oscillospiraceae bacterium]|nr:hypothetical protein [Oscillospiraceae bacterium]
MLYVTTRDKYDASTTPKSLLGDRGADGGLYLPFRMPIFTEAELEEFVSGSFGQTVAHVLNLFFSCRLNGWDVEFCIGRYPVKVTDIKQRIFAAELWHNSQNSYSRLENALSEKVREAVCGDATTSWLRVAIRISVLFGVYGEMLRTGAVASGSCFDVSVATGDFSCAMAVWYARQMGLPIANIICGCNENGAVWELLHHGEVHTDAAAVKTTTPDADVAIPVELERLICGALGQEEARRFCNVCAEGDIYAPKQGMLDTLRSGMFAAVISNERLAALIPNVFATTNYILGPYAALSYGGLLDYRTKNREGRPALLVVDKNPACDVEYTASAMGLTVSLLKEKLGVI